jgi:nitroreductase
MELYDVMRTTFACREFTGEPVPRDVLHRIIDHARFAPSGGNRQGWRIINITDPAKKERLAYLSTWRQPASSELGPGSEFGFEIPLQFFGLPPPSPKPPPPRFGIRSVSVSLPYPISKTRYLSSTSCTIPPQVIRLIIGGCVL